jgi:hypothetical protein
MIDRYNPSSSVIFITESALDCFGELRSYDCVDFEVLQLVKLLKQSLEKEGTQNELNLYFSGPSGPLLDCRRWSPFKLPNKHTIWWRELVET